jgi:acyl carrier protein
MTDYHLRVREIIASVHHVPVDAISLEQSFEELGIDSLERESILFTLEEAFQVQIPDECLYGAHNVREVIENVVALLGVVASAPLQRS